MLFSSRNVVVYRVIQIALNIWSVVSGVVSGWE